MAQLVIPEPFPSIHLPEGFRLKSVAEENDLAKIDRVLWRGFNHPGEPPEDSIEGREKMQYRVAGSSGLMVERGLLPWILQPRRQLVPHLSLHPRGQHVLVLCQERLHRLGVVYDQRAQCPR